MKDVNGVKANLDGGVDKKELPVLGQADRCDAIRLFQFARHTYIFHGTYISLDSLCFLSL